MVYIHIFPIKMVYADSFELHSGQKISGKLHDVILQLCSYQKQ